MESATLIVDQIMSLHFLQLIAVLGMCSALSHHMYRESLYRGPVGHSAVFTIAIFRSSIPLSGCSIVVGLTVFSTVVSEDHGWSSDPHLYVILGSGVFFSSLPSHCFLFVNRLTLLLTSSHSSVRPLSVVSSSRSKDIEHLQLPF